MRIFKYGEIKNAPGGGVIALGFFDGVHSAHRSLLRETKNKAREIGAPFGIFTFSAESEIKVGSPRLYSTEERLDFFEELGADFAVVADFAAICTLSPEEFVGDALIDGLRARIAYAGFNFKFGRGASADSEDLIRLMRAHGRDAVICDEITDGGEVISATAIRGLIETGRIERANEILGTPYYVRGIVERGNGNGHSLGFPTVNTALDKKRVKPKNGVYRSAVSVRGRLYNGVTNIGSCPTLGEREIHAETYIIDFSESIYGETVRVYLLGYLREEKVFSSPKELIMQIEVDKKQTLDKNGEEKWQELGLK